ncbi:Hypothetical protein Minf_1518 [Methylacidiphilum infernorum V4]|uniref:Uncharacterized protein n=1 Tax=Methylacidiphilum infernorum (isolate V4) TaxID=481448 RepID=B3DW69_METI4|nr:Hypothetical protein Minf_1518 [Methylacidiphilum infernorum V4]
MKNLGKIFLSLRKRGKNEIRAKTEEKEKKKVGTILELSNHVLFLHISVISTRDKTKSNEAVQAPE